MGTEALEFSNVFQEEMGGFNDGFLKLSRQNVQFKNKGTGKVLTIAEGDIDHLGWQKLGNKAGLKVVTNSGTHHRFGGLKESDLERISTFSSSKWQKSIRKNELSLKGWNYGEAEFEGQNLVFNVADKVAFEIPLSNVMRCQTAKSEAIVEFHPNEECPVQLTEMRFHIPYDPENEDQDVVEEFRKEVLRFAEVESEAGQAIATLSDILLATPLLRLQNGRHMYFVLHVNPAVRQGQTRYPFLVLECSKEDYIELELGCTEEQLAQQYNNKLDMHMKGYLYEIMAKIFRVIVNSRIIVPGNFTGASGTPAISCAVRQSMGFLYPLEKGFVYVHKPALYMRFEEVDNVHFARSDVSLPMSGKRNTTRLGEKSYKEADKFAGSSDEELDPYKEKLKDDARERAAESESDSEDEDFNVEKEMRNRKVEKDSSEGSGSEPDEEYSDGGGSDVSDDLMETDKAESKEKDGAKKKKKGATESNKEQKSKREKKKDKDGKKGEKKKDPNAPKRNQSAFFLWQSENRPQIKKPGDSVVDTAARAGQMWKAMSADEKQPYEQKAKDDKERYEREMSEYQSKKGDGGEATSSAGAGQTSSSTKKSQSSPSKKPISKEFVDSSNSSDSE
uniref:FACT complex subunit SSRP1 n=1 Tax=Globodera rostochiensis TaxID=31243 RepID=A0A914H0T7_GLORO